MPDAANPWELGITADGYVEGGGELALRFRDHANQDVFVWTSLEPTVPVFWTSLFPVGFASARGVLEVEGVYGLEALERRRASWKAKSGATVFRGYEAFVRWVREHPAKTIILDLASAKPFRRQPFTDAISELIAFIDDASAAPGPLLSPWRETVGWKLRKGQLRLECFYADAAWPGEVPLFGAGAFHVMTTTTGEPPFRRGPWPEHRFVANLGEPWSDAERTSVNARAQEARELFAVCPVPAPTRLDPMKFGNLDVVAAKREHWAAFIARATRYADSAAAFAAAHRVFDEGPLWRAYIRQTEALVSQLDRIEAEIRAAMRAHER